MGNVNEIESGSIILSYSFIYDPQKIQDDDCSNELPKIENLLSYADRIYEKNRLYDFNILDNKKSKEVFLKIENKNSANLSLYKLKIEYVKILFFQDNIATLYLKVIPNTKSLQDYYEINRALTQFYAKQKGYEAYIYAGEQSKLEIKISEQEFIELLQVKEVEKDSQKYIDALDKEVPNGRVIFEDKSVVLKKTKIKEEPYIIVKPLQIKGLTKIIVKKYYPNYIPDEDESIKSINHEYPERIALTKKEKAKFKNEKLVPRHYFEFKDQIDSVNSKYQKYNSYEFLHYDTFITSFIIKFVAENTGFKYYDNFNPIATNYINSYITIECNNLDEEYKNNFVLFEPLINSKISQGKQIVQTDFFHVYQSQSDTFTIGNSHAILHLLDKNSKNIKTNKEETHFHIYMLTSVQRNFILNIINTSIVNISGFDKKDFTLKNLYHTFHYLVDTVDKYNTFLTDYNFQVISNSSSVDNSYSFFRKCNEVDKLASQWNSISFKVKDWKSILEHILQKRPSLFFLAILIAGVGLKTLNSIIDYIWHFIF